MSGNANNPVFVYALLQPQIQSLQLTLDDFFMFFMAVFIFFMQFGFAVFEAGVARASYSMKRTLLKSCLVIFLVMVVYWLFGYALAFGGVNVFGGGQMYWAFSNVAITQYAHFWLQYCYAVTATVVALGALSERCHTATYLVFAFVWAGFVYPIVSHWTWSLVGFLYMGQSISYSNVSNYQLANMAVQYLYNPSAMNPAMVATAAQYLDLAGSGIVHVSGGVAALVGAIILGPRHQRFHPAYQHTFVPHSSTLLSIGCGIIFFGMLAFNCAGLQTINLVPAGMAAMAMFNTVLSIASSILFVYVVGILRSGTYDYFRILKAGIAGAVAISCSAGVIFPWGAVIVGTIAGLSFLIWSSLLVRWRIDDVTDAFAVHAGAGMWGLIAFSFLHPQFGILFSVPSAGLFLGWQLAGISCIIVWCGAIAAIIFGILRLFKIMRLTSEDELKGVDNYGKLTQVIAADADRGTTRSLPVQSENEYEQDRDAEKQQTEVSKL